VNLAARAPVTWPPHCLAPPAASVGRLNTLTYNRNPGDTPVTGYVFLEWCPIPLVPMWTTLLASRVIRVFHKWHVIGWQPVHNLWTNVWIQYMPCGYKPLE